MVQTLVLILPATTTLAQQPTPARTMYIIQLTGVGEADFDLTLKRIGVSLKKKWNDAMPDTVLRGQKGKVVLEFGLKDDGTIVDQLVKTAVGSGDQTLDDAAISAVRNAAPFDRLPVSYAGPRVAKISLRVVFLYNLPLQTPP